jgi:hypothetical protein
MTHSLLIIACSQRKAAGLAAGAAWDVYDGVLYRVLKKRLGPRNNWPAWFDLLIVSAKYGIIRPGRSIQPCTAAPLRPRASSGKERRSPSTCRWGGPICRASVSVRNATRLRSRPGQPLTSRRRCGGCPTLPGSGLQTGKTRKSLGHQ